MAEEDERFSQHSRASSFRDGEIGEEKSKKTKKDKHDRGLFKGLGNMFRLVNFIS